MASIGATRTIVLAVLLVVVNVVVVPPRWLPWGPLGALFSRCCCCVGCGCCRVSVSRVVAVVATGCLTDPLKVVVVVGERCCSAAAAVSVPVPVPALVSADAAWWC